MKPVFATIEPWNLSVDFQQLSDLFWMISIIYVLLFILHIIILFYKLAFLIGLKTTKITQNYLFPLKRYWTNYKSFLWINHFFCYFPSCFITFPWWWSCRGLIILLLKAWWIRLIFPKLKSIILFDIESLVILNSNLHYGGRFTTNESFYCNNLAKHNLSAPFYRIWLNWIAITFPNRVICQTISSA